MNDKKKYARRQVDIHPSNLALIDRVKPVGMTYARFLNNLIISLYGKHWLDNLQAEIVEQNKEENKKGE